MYICCLYDFFQGPPILPVNWPRADCNHTTHRQHLLKYLCRLWGCYSSQPFPHLDTVCYQSSVMYNREVDVIPCLFLCLLTATKWNQCIFRPNNFTKLTFFFFSFLHNIAHKTRWLLEKYFSQHCIHIYRQRISKSNAQASR